MEKSKVMNHCYPTRRNKIPKLEENNENSTKSSTALSKTKNAESPSSSRLCMISGYASPPCRLVTLSQQNENEIEWDLTSPSARKYQVLFSDKKTSTPNRTPTRSKREIRPRIALCKKNIALAEEDKSVDLVNELAALNDLVNSEQAQILMSPPQSVKGLASSNDESPSDRKRPPVPKSLNTSDIFDDDSFFSESILLSTQAIEEEAIGCNRTPTREKKFLNETLMTPTSTSPNQSCPLLNPSPEGNSTRKSFDLDEDECEPQKFSLTTVTKPSVPNGVSRQPSREPTVKSLSTQSSKNLPAENSVYQPSNNLSGPQKEKPDVFQPPGKTVPRFNFQNKQVTKVDSSHQNNSAKVHRQTDSNKKTPLPQVNNIAKQLPKTRNAVERSPKPSFPSALPTVTSHELIPPQHSNSTSIDLFDDDDDDLLCAIADEVESQYVPVASKSEINDDSDDGFFQPEVLAYISQIESQVITSTEKSTADILEEKRQAAIRKRQERLMSRR